IHRLGSRPGIETMSGEPWRRPISLLDLIDGRQAGADLPPAASQGRDEGLVHFKFDGHLAQAAAHRSDLAKLWIEIILQQRRARIPDVEVGMLFKIAGSDNI